MLRSSPKAVSRHLQATARTVEADKLPSWARDPGRRAVRTHRATAPGHQDGTLLGRPHRAAHIPQPLCRQDRPRMQRLPTTAPSIRQIATQSTPSDTFLVNPPSTARFADLRQNDRQRRSHQALTAGAEREDAPSRTAHLTHRAVPAPSRTCSPHAPAAPAAEAVRCPS